MKLHTRSRHGLDDSRDDTHPDPTRHDSTLDDAPRTEAASPAAAEPTPLPHKPRTSMWAVLALIAGVLAVATALTGVLAALAAALGLITVALALLGLHAGGKVHVTGRGVALLALLFGLVGAVAGALAITGAVPGWDTSNHVAWLHGWLDARAPWLVIGTG